MKSYTALRNLYGKYTQNSTTANLTQGDEYINDGHRLVLGAKDWPFLYKTSTMTTSAATQFKEMPLNVGKVNVVTVTVSSTIYTPKLIESERRWQQLNMITQNSDIPEYAFVRGGQLGIWPTPVTAGNTITVYHKQLVRDLSIADYTTGGILTATNGSTSITGTGTSWTTSMAGRYIRITESDTANKGDGYWYEIASVSSSTSLTLVKSYQGTSISAGNAAFTIGQMPLLPEAYHMLPVYYAAAEYWDGKTTAPVRSHVITRAGKYQQKYQELLAQLIHEYSSRTTSPVISSGGDTQRLENPNLFVTL